MEEPSHENSQRQYSKEPIVEGDTPAIFDVFHGIDFSFSRGCNSERPQRDAACVDSAFGCAYATPRYGGGRGPVAFPVFKTEWAAVIPAPVGSTPMRPRHRLRR